MLLLILAVYVIGAMVTFFVVAALLKAAEAKQIWAPVSAAMWPLFVPLTVLWLIRHIFGKEARAEVEEPTYDDPETPITNLMMDPARRKERLRLAMMIDEDERR